MASAEHGLGVTDIVTDRNGHARWVVRAFFVDVDGSEPRCIEYRVRVVPKAPDRYAASLAAQNIADELERDDAKTRRRPPVWTDAESTAPPEGIPQRVFEEASQSRLLAKAREMIRANPSAVKVPIAQFVERQSRARAGRPPIRSIGEKLRILQAVEDAFANGRTLESVADDFYMSRSGVRDLLNWARRSAEPRLFTGAKPGVRGGELTPAARALIKEVSDGER